jgi:hypothetical protein
VFGSYEGPGRLPYAVSAFFAGGGRRAYVVRIVHDHGNAVVDAAGRASGVLGGLTTTDGDPIELVSRNEGSWGNRLQATLRFVTRPIAVRSSTTTEVVVDRREWIPVGSLLRLGMAGGARALAFVDDSVERPGSTGADVPRVVTIAGGLATAPVMAEVVTGVLDVVDLDQAYPRREQLADLGLRADHPRWLARALANESELVWPGEAWAAGTIDLTDPRLGPVALVGPDSSPTMSGGQDRWQLIEPADFFDPSWVPGDEEAGEGVQSLVDLDDVGLLLAPDLYDPRPLPATDDVTDPVTLCSADFALHVQTAPGAPPTPPPPGLDALRRDPLVPSELAEIVAAQQLLVDEAERRRDLTALLDAPLGLPQRKVLGWRNEFDSPYAAAYHPWLDVAAPDDQRESLVRINPSAFAAGIIARRELRLGVQHGPANEIAISAVRVADVVLPEQHDELHIAGINVYQPDRDGIRLTAARTLSRRPDLRQLSVARLMTVLRLTLEREMQWAVFEPNNRELWAEVRRLVHDLLTRFYAAGAFRGATTKDAFFVRCDATTMTQNDLDNGRMICLVGVAPAEPTEYIVIEIALAADTGVRVEVAR